MRSVRLVALIAAAVATTAQGSEEEPLQSRISSLGLFKNGFCLVTREVEVPGAGRYPVDLAPDSVHGTFWVESDAVASVRFTHRSLEVSMPPAGADLVTDLAGREVRIHFRDSELAPVEGRVVGGSQAEAEPDWNRTYETPGYGAWWGGRAAPAAPASRRFLVLETGSGYVHVDSGMIGYVEARGGQTQSVRRQPVMMVEVRENRRARIQITYLTKGLAWAPSYRIDLTDPDRLRLVQKAVIKNELESFEGAEVYLISGFPHLEFSHVGSPLSLQTSWAQFFQQLATRPGSVYGSSPAATQQVLMNAASPNDLVDLSALPTGDGPDVHYQSIGRIDLAEGDALYASVGREEADYERIVEWIVPDTRDVWGRRVSDHERERDPERYRDAAWDAVQFRNPLPFPLTTAAAVLMEGGRLLGQGMIHWTDPGEQTRLHVTKALSVRTRSLEREEPDSREIVRIAGDDFTKVTVAGTLMITNHRGEDVPLLLRRRFSGEMVEADDSPRVSLLEEGAYSVNPRHELQWKLTLGPGEAKEIGYRYTVLVRR